MYAESPRKILLVGSLGEDEVSSLGMYCAQLQKYGQTELLVDIDGVADCDDAGLRGLLALCAQTDIAVSVEGARWSQFMDLLSRVPIAEVQRHCDEVRGLVGSTHVPSSRVTAE